MPPRPSNIFANLVILLLLGGLVLSSASGAEEMSRGLPQSPDYFPLAVWLQKPEKAGEYKRLGINLYVGLWKGPTEEQLAELERQKMPVICSFNEMGLKQIDRKIIVGWLMQDEPDNAQSLPGGKGYGPPVPPEKVVEQYKAIRQADPSRPVLLNLSQGVAWDGWRGRGVRSNHPEDYPEYAKAGDILSFDIYPATHDKRAVAGKLWYVGYGVQRLRQWSEDKKPVWACIETTHVGNPETRVTPEQVRAEAWIAIIHGARGLIYFSHQFKPKFIEAGLLAYPDTAKMMAITNQQIQHLAPVLNSPTLAIGSVESSEANVPIAMMVKRHGGATYVFAVSMRNDSTTGTFMLPDLKAGTKVTVLGEERTIDAAEGKWRDAFEGYEVHLYKIE